MNELEQNIAIAEYCGWKKVPTPSGHCHVYHGDFVWYKEHAKLPYSNAIDLPDYRGDLNDIHDAMQFGRVDDNHVVFQRRYEDMLQQVVYPDFDHTELLTSVLQFSITNATAAQRCEAFLKTIGKWVD